MGGFTYSIEIHIKEFTKEKVLELLSALPNHLVRINFEDNEFVGNETEDINEAKEWALKNKLRCLCSELKYNLDSEGRGYPFLSIYFRPIVETLAPGATESYTAPEQIIEIYVVEGRNIEPNEYT